MIIKELLSGDVLKRQEVRRQYKLVALIAVLIFIYIYNGYASQRQMRHYNELQKQLEDARYEHLTIHAELMEWTRQSAIQRKLQEKGSSVQANTTPVIHIY